jgi:c-di-GMP-related signal transduction protein
MNALELLQKNPDAAKVIREYYVELMLNSLDESLLPENFKDFLKEQGIDDEKVAQMMEANARNVYDVLDENGFVISMNWDMAFDKFSYHINDDQYKLLYDSRKEAENAAVNVAIHRLQNKLNPQPSAEVYED